MAPFLSIRVAATHTKVVLASSIAFSIVEDLNKGQSITSRSPLRLCYKACDTAIIPEAYKGQLQSYIIRQYMDKVRQRFV